MMGKNLYKDLAQATKTPFYLFDIDCLNEHIVNIKNILGDTTELCYAMKANPFLVSDISKQISRIEVCSFGEYEICLKNNIPSDKIIYSGVVKTKEELEFVFLRVDADKIIFTIESLEQWHLLLETTKKYNKNVDVLLRLTSGNQFGMGKNEIHEILKNYDNSFINIIGIHYYGGTQKKKISDIINAFINVTEFMLELENKYKIELKEIEFGPGFNIDYFKEIDDMYIQVKEINEFLQEACYKWKIRLELGRFLVSDCGFYATTVVDCKNSDDKNYALVDGGIHHLNYYGQILGMKLPKHDLFSKNKSSKNNLNKWKVCGALCTEADVIIKEYEADVNIGDIFLFHKVGAYSVTEAPFLFLSRNLPSVYYLNNGEKILIRDVVKSSNINSVY